MTLIREPNAQQIAQFSVPFKGTWKSVAANQLSQDSLYDSYNVWIREGKLRERFGISSHSPTVLSNPVLGGGMAVSPDVKTNISFTLDKTHYMSDPDTVWSELTSRHDGLVDTTFLLNGLVYYTLLCDGVNPIKQFTIILGAASESTVTALSGTIPSPISICTSSRRVVALTYPHTLNWSEVFDHQTWDAASYLNVSQTNDVGIKILPLTSIAFVLYKERSIYIFRATGQPFGGAFAPSEPIIVEGPAGLHAVINVSGSHMYMTKNGRIGIFDGTRAVQWIADGLWLYLQNDIDPEFANNIFGVFDYRLNTIVFWYPKVGDNGEMKGMVILNLPLEGSGIDNISAFLGTSVVPMSYGYETRFNNQIDRTLVFSSEFLDYRSYYLNEDFDQDDDQYFDWSFQTGLVPLEDSRHYAISIEAFFERNRINGRLSMFPVYSNLLENKTGTIFTDDESVIDLSNDSFTEYSGFTKQARFFGIKVSGNSQSNLRYAGCNVYGRPMS